MKAKDIVPGTVYAYRRDRYDTPRPIVFLTPVDRDHLHIESTTYGRRFKKAPEGSTPRARTIYNGGTIGYPAALGNPDSDLNDLRAVTLARFQGVTSTLGRRCEYTLVVRLARVIGPWESAAPTNAED